MKKHVNYTETVKAAAFRQTKARQLISAIFKKNPLPMTEAEVRQKLSEKGVKVNKTTTYREFERLKSIRAIKEVNFGDGKKRYETESGHHHHLICNGCKKVSEVHIDDGLKKFEKKIGKTKDFQIINHSLEFFGLCKDCLQK